MNTDKTAFEIARRGGKVEAIDGDRILVSSGKPNHVIHFLLGLCTFGLWWVVVWAPVSIAANKRRVIYSNTPSADLRLPHELPAPLFTTISSIVIAIVVFAVTGNIVAAVLAVILWAVVLRALANR